LARQGDRKERGWKERLTLNMPGAIPSAQWTLERGEYLERTVREDQKGEEKSPNAKYKVVQTESREGVL